MEITGQKKDRRKKKKKFKPLSQATTDTEKQI